MTLLKVPLTVAFWAVIAIFVAVLIVCLIVAQWWPWKGDRWVWEDGRLCDPRERVVA